MPLSKVWEIHSLVLKASQLLKKKAKVLKFRQMTGYHLKGKQDLFTALSNLKGHSSVGEEEQ